MQPGRALGCVGHLVGHAGVQKAALSLLQKKGSGAGAHLQRPLHRQNHFQFFVPMPGNVQKGHVVVVTGQREKQRAMGG